MKYRESGVILILLTQFRGQLQGARGHFLARLDW